ncbi:MAG: 50S ribosomal protein L10 [Ignavibacteriales bacterium CG_4_9_14_3_um_filter_34_10]|nr:MAG: 50S ribosomal protein L10 [Ignavibacteriales bacterium CG_4_9_14_3_um_filter_34_10]
MKTKNEKAELISEIQEKLKSSSAVYLVDYSRITVAEISALRKEFLKEGVSYKVFKNTLFQKALENLDQYPEFSNYLTGMTGFVFANENNFIAPAKIIKKFSEDKKKFYFKGCYVENQFYGSDQLDVLASMPSKEEVIAGIIGSIASPASGIVGAINAVMRELVSVIDEISKKKVA